MNMDKLTPFENQLITIALMEQATVVLRPGYMSVPSMRVLLATTWWGGMRVCDGSRKRDHNVAMPRMFDEGSVREWRHLTWRGALALRKVYRDLSHSAILEIPAPTSNGAQMQRGGIAPAGIATATSVALKQRATQQAMQQNLYNSLLSDQQNALNGQALKNYAVARDSNSP